MAANWITDARKVRDARRRARHSADHTSAHHAETAAVLETAAWGILVLIVALLIVLIITPS